MNPPRSPMMIVLSLVAGILVSACVLLAAKIHNPTPAEPLDQEFLAYLGDEVPPFEWTGLDGKRVSNTEWAGRAYLLFFGDPDCSACSEVYPQLQNVAQKVPVLMISVGNLESLYQKRDEYHFTFPIILDETGAIGEAFHVKGYPTVMLIDAKGRLHKASSGNLPAAQVLALAEGRIE